MRSLSNFFLLLLALGGIYLGIRFFRPKPALPQHRVLCAGDSITHGVALASPDDAYPAALGRLLGDDYLVMNGGVTGCTFLKKGDWPYWGQDAFEQGANFYPEIVVLMLGTNDAKAANWRHKADFDRDALAMLNHYLGLASHPQVYLCLPCPVFAPLPEHASAAKLSQAIDGRTLEKEIVPRLIKVAAKAGVAVIDIHALMQARASDFPDGIHPNAKANADIAMAVFKQIHPLK
jgi:alpha-L-fucosidase 2